MQGQGEDSISRLNQGIKPEDPLISSISSPRLGNASALSVEALSLIENFKLPISSAGISHWITATSFFACQYPHFSYPSSDCKEYYPDSSHQYRAPSRTRLSATTQSSITRKARKFLKFYLIRFVIHSACTIVSSLDSYR